MSDDMVYIYTATSAVNCDKPARFIYNCSCRQLLVQHFHKNQSNAVVHKRFRPVYPLRFEMILGMPQ